MRGIPLDCCYFACGFGMAAYPTRPVRLIVGFTAAGAVHITTRLMG
jgi:tripartite-type tricarboxylate transporter receptor subunit TctC